MTSIYPVGNNVAILESTDIGTLWLTLYRGNCVWHCMEQTLAEYGEVFVANDF